MNILGSLLIVITTMGMWFSTVAEAQWTQVKGFPTDAGTVSSFASEGTNLFATTPRGLLISTDAGTYWHWTRLRGTEVKSIAISNRKLFVVTDEGLVGSNDNGSTWAVLLKNPKLTDTEMKQLKMMQQIKTKNPNFTVHIPRSIQAVAVTVATNDTMIWAGTDGNYLFASHDQGKTWFQIRGFSSIYNLAVNDAGLMADVGAESNFRLRVIVSDEEKWLDGSVDVGKIFAFAYDGKNILLGTESGLQTFRFSGGRLEYLSGPGYTIGKGLPVAQKVSSFAVIGTNIFAATPSGVFQSTDGGATFYQVNTGLDSVAVECLMALGNQIFAGSNKGIYRHSLASQPSRPENLNQIKLDGTWAGSAKSSTDRTRLLFFLSSFDLTQDGLQLSGKVLAYDQYAGLNVEGSLSSTVRDKSIEGVINFHYWARTVNINFKAEAVDNTMTGTYSGSYTLYGSPMDIGNGWFQFAKK